MESTPKKIITSCDNSNNKVNIMSQYQGFGQYIDPTLTGSPQKSGEYDDVPYGLFDLLTGNDYLFNPEISPELNSSMTTPSLIFDGIPTPHELNDSPLFNSSFISSPSLEPALGFFPDLTTDPNVSSVATGRTLMQINIPSSSSSIPSVTIPMDDSPFSSSSIPGPSLSPALTIPWSTEVMNSPSTVSSMSSPVTSPSSSDVLIKNRKRDISKISKYSQLETDELALKRAKNTDAARRSRQRKAMKLDALEKQVTNLKTENNDLQTRIAVLESEKKGLEDKNVEKDARVKMLEQQLAEAHERLIKRTKS